MEPKTDVVTETITITDTITTNRDATATTAATGAKTEVSVPTTSATAKADPNSLEVAFLVYAIAAIVSMGVAVVIKLMTETIHSFGKKNAESE